MIIIEGPDASGKSTLADYLANALCAPVQHSEGPPRAPNEINERCERYSLLPHNTIFDRHPAVSEPIYSTVLGRHSDLDPVWRNITAAALIIYCDVDHPHLHTVKDHDTAQHIADVHQRFQDLLLAYRDWAIREAHVIYRIGDSKQRIVDLATNYIRDIEDFHYEFAIQYAGPPRALPDELRRFRIKFLAEELCEYAGVTGAPKQLIQSVLVEATPPPMIEQFDSLIDLVYVALGTAHMHGFPFSDGWHRVHAANMRKKRVASPTDSPRQSAFDVVKPPAWQPPHLADLLRQEG